MNNKDIKKEIEYFLKIFKGDDYLLLWQLTESFIRWVLEEDYETYDYNNRGVIRLKENNKAIFRIIYDYKYLYGRKYYVLKDIEII